jgi:HTH-type transcriptional regulator, transcriptional repressor of NAD biosynthesis genes
MTGNGHGLVIGKFYPPHLGHQHLITQAAASCTELTVLVMAASGESLPLADRVSWLRAAFAGTSGVTVAGTVCDAPVDFDDPVIWAAQLAVIQAALDRDQRPPADIVFSSEDYGHELAGRLGARHVAVDPGRRSVPISGRQLRADLAGHWNYLIDPAQAGLAARVVLVGAESTGTSTLAGLLAMHYRAQGRAWARTCCVAEAGRDFTITKWQQARAAAAAAGRPGPPLAELEWTAADFDAVAAEQTRRENQAATSGSPLVVCDTDAFATSVWERRYLGERVRCLQPWATTLLPPRDVYLLTSHEGVPWHDDGLREGDLAIRAAMTGWFTAALTAAGHSWVLLTGTLEDRLALATRVTDYVLDTRSRFGAAITDDPGTEGSRADAEAR